MYTDRTSEVTAQTAFSQQRIEAWRPLFTPKIVIILCLFFGALFTGLGILFFFSSRDSPEFSVRYDNVELINGTNQKIVSIKLDQEMKGNLFLFYKLTNFYQNHRRYLFSKSDDQLRGEFVDYEGMSECDRYRSHNNSKEMKDWILPCGAVAYSFFNDTFSIDTAPANVTFMETGISWRSDREKLFKRLSPMYTEGDKWLESMNDTYPQGQRNEHFIVWMRTASFPTFLKPYSRCLGCTLPKGEYKITIEDNYPTSSFGGQKWLVLAQLNPMGGRNYPIAYGYMGYGGFLLLSGIIILVSHLCFPRTLGDTSYLMSD